MPDYLGDDMRKVKATNDGEKDEKEKEIKSKLICNLFVIYQNRL